MGKWELCYPSGIITQAQSAVGSFGNNWLIYAQYYAYSTPLPFLSFLTFHKNVIQKLTSHPHSAPKLTTEAPLSKKLKRYL